MSTTSDSNSDIDISETVEAQDKKWFVDLTKASQHENETTDWNVLFRKTESYLEAEDFRLDEGKRFAVDFDEAFAFLCND